jgi:ATP-dependent Lon protease
MEVIRIDGYIEEQKVAIAAYWLGVGLSGTVSARTRSCSRRRAA